MSKEAMTWAEGQKIHDGTVLAVLRAIAWHADKGTGECRKSQEQIGRHAGLSVRAVRYALAILEKLEIVRRRSRSKGKLGRTTDAIMLSMDRTFDVSKSAIVSLRKAVRSPLQPAHRADSTKSCNRHTVPPQPAPCAEQYNQVNQEEPYQSEDSHTEDSKGTYVGGPRLAENSEMLIHEKAAGADSGLNVVLFRPRASA